MSWLRRIELIEPYYRPPPPSAVILRETSIFAAPKTLHCPFPSFFEEVEEDYELGYALELLSPTPIKTPSLLSYGMIRRVERLGGELFLQSLSDRVSELESRFDRLAKVKLGGDRKYTWTAEIKGPEKHGLERKYKLTTDIKEGKHKNKAAEEATAKKYKWTAEIEGKGEISRKYSFTASSGGDSDSSDTKEKKEKKKTKGKNGSKKEKKEESDTRLVEIEELVDHGAVVLRQAFAKRAGGSRNVKGKRKELSPQDAAMMIQMTFRAYLIRRSQALRALRDLAVAKSKLKELRALFNNFSYRRRVAHDAAERQRFTERIIVLLLTVDAIEGVDVMVRSAKRSMVDELEAMLDVVDPQPAGAGKSLSMKRRTFDMPDGVIQREIAEGVAQVVQMLEREENSSNTFEACL
ncbi:BAG family molecular chaperone regulator 7-like [Pyrus ussuriensis x Pyrus communis]|uniref:BAG family molecular chaperone regulator 7-like n=1 Tax=Pyrus ussuriensis x Pyrus communis TaxID=2448454 RepID=A0A5N5F693_9ROSA|nr:BAG family molecular chaperone regulator 7-like [Pyrus ussuriensis x Pyrus communis]